jgi:hypothetical protein
VPRAASASAFLRMAAFTGAERAHGSAAWTSCKGDVRGKVGSRLEWCFSQCGGRACDHALSWSSPRPPSPTLFLVPHRARLRDSRRGAHVTRLPLEKTDTHFGYAFRVACRAAGGLLCCNMKVLIHTERAPEHRGRRAGAAPPPGRALSIFIQVPELPYVTTHEITDRSS